MSFRIQIKVFYLNHLFFHPLHILGGPPLINKEEDSNHNYILSHPIIGDLGIFIQVDNQILELELSQLNLYQQTLLTVVSMTFLLTILILIIQLE